MNDREQRLQALADENGYWADEELHLIETIRRYEKRLAELPDIIRWLNEEQERVTTEMNRVGAEHDALEAEGDDAEFRAWVNAMSPAYFMAWSDDQAAAYADWQETIRRPNY